MEYIMKLQNPNSNTSSFPTILLQKSTKPLTNPILKNNSYHMLSKSIKSKRKLIYNENNPKQKMTKRIFNLWKTSRTSHKLSKKDFIKQNKQIVANLNNLNHVKELDYFSRKMLFDNYLKTYLRAGLTQKQKRNMFSDYMKAKGKQDESDRFLLSCQRSRLEKEINKRKKKSCSITKKTKKGRFYSTRQGHHVILSKKPKSFTLVKNKSTGRVVKRSTSKKLKVVTSRPKGMTPKNYVTDHPVGFSPFNLRFKKIDFSRDNIFTQHSDPKSKESHEEEFEYMVANSFQKMKKVQAIDRLENIMNGNQHESTELLTLDSTNPVVLNCDLKKILNFYKQKLKGMKTKYNYMEKHNGKLNKVFEG